MNKICKICLVNKEYNYLCLNSQSRATYVDEKNEVWHGKRCYSCHKARVIDKAGKSPLATKSCPRCTKEFKQKNGSQRFCSGVCRLG